MMSSAASIDADRLTDSDIVVPLSFAWTLSRNSAAYFVIGIQCSVNNNVLGTSRSICMICRDTFCSKAIGGWFPFTVRWQCTILWVVKVACLPYNPWKQRQKKFTLFQMYVDAFTSMYSSICTLQSWQGNCSCRMASTFMWVLSSVWVS